MLLNVGDAEHDHSKDVHGNPNALHRNAQRDAQRDDAI
jgi:hypothetical protein